MRITLSAAAVQTTPGRRTLSGLVYRYGETGQTSAGPLRIEDPNALRWPADPTSVPLTLEHDQPYVVRGNVAMVDNNPERLYIATRVVDGELGDAALEDAISRTRAAFSFDIENAEVVDGVIVGADVIAIGQVRDPAFNSARIDQIAASNPVGTSGVNPMKGTRMNEEQRRRLAELVAMNTRTPEEEGEYQQLVNLAAQELATTEPTDPAAPAAPAAPAPAAATAVAASIPAVPTGGGPLPGGATTRPRAGQAFPEFVRQMADGLRRRSLPTITAALADITWSDHQGVIEQPAWSGELWSGVQYQPVWSDLFTSATLDHWDGVGWRFTQKAEISDYAGDKAEIPTTNVATESSSYEAARMAVGVDIDRKFFDFPNAGFIESLFQQVRESWEIKKDGKVRAYSLANAHTTTKSITVTTTNADATITAATGTFKDSDVGATITGAGIPAAATIASVTNSGSAELSANATASATITATLKAQEATLLKAAARGVLDLRRRLVGSASFVVINDEDMFDLLDIAEKDLPVFLDLYDIDPRNFRSDPLVGRGQVLVGAKQTATVRVLPGSPIRVDAQNLLNGGVDDAFFGYWAIEEHHTSGIAAVTYKPAA